MVTIEHKASFPVSVTEHAVMSPAGVFGFDTPKTVEEHYRDFADIGGAKLAYTEQNELALECGVESGLIVIQIGANRGDFVPNLDAGSYGVEHTALGNLLTKTKRVVDINNGTTSVIFGIVPSQWPDGIHSCTLVQPDLEGRGAINLLGDGSSQPTEPTPGYRFYTPFFHNKGAGSGFIDRSDVYPLYHLGIMTLNRSQLSELLRAFNKDWTNGPVFARKNAIGQSPEVSSTR
jgi:hypothetical protein